MPDLATLKAHCRVDHSVEDVILQGYLDAASGHLASVGVDMDADPLPDAVGHAVLMLAASFYEQREAASPTPLQMVQLGVDRLIAPYREAQI